VSKDHWQRYPKVGKHPSLRSWLEYLRIERKLASDTLAIYARSLEDYLAFHERFAPQAPLERAGPEVIIAYRDDLLRREPYTARGVRRRTGPEGLAPGTAGLRLNVIRLYYDHLRDRGDTDQNPVDPVFSSAQLWAYRQTGRFADGGAAADRWLPTVEEWQRFLGVAAWKSIRTRTMLALAYDAALRREELVALELADLDWEGRRLTVRAKTTKRRETRHVPYSAITARLLEEYRLVHRDTPVLAPTAALFISESNRTRGRPLSPIMWSKIVQGLAEEADLPRISTNTLRHRRLAQLAGAGLPLEELAPYLGHHSSQRAAPYYRLGARADPVDDRLDVHERPADDLAVLLGVGARHRAQ